MARKTIVSLVDDLDGGQAAETVSFSLDGVTYDIDLSESNAGKLRAALAGFIPVARRTGGRARPGGTPRPGGTARQTPTRTSSERSASIREWARANGYTVSNRGRIAEDVVTAYDKAH
jgi:hypothetical protein